MDHTITRGCVETGVPLYDPTFARSTTLASRNGAHRKVDILLYDGLRFCWLAWYFSQTWDRKVEPLLTHSQVYS